MTFYGWAKCVHDLSSYYCSLAGDGIFNRAGQARSKRKVPLFLVSKQNLNPSSWPTGHISNGCKRIRDKKVTDPPK